MSNHLGVTAAREPEYLNWSRALSQIVEELNTGLNHLEARLELVSLHQQDNLLNEPLGPEVPLSALCEFLRGETHKLQSMNTKVTRMLKDLQI